MKEEALEPPVPNGERFILTVLGADGIGNIHGIAGCLAANGVNIVDLHARADGTRFSLIMEAFLPPISPQGRCGPSSNGIGRDHGLEAYVQHENIFLATSEPSPRAWDRPGKRKETPLHRTEDVLSTLGMIRQHKLDVRTVTMGIDLQPCALARHHGPLAAGSASGSFVTRAGLGAVCLEVEGRYGIPIVNRRIAVSPIAAVAAGHSAEGYLAVARTLDAVAAEVEVDLGRWIHARSSRRAQLTAIAG